MKYELTLSADIRQADAYQSGGSLQIREIVEFSVDDFMQLCSILAEFHKLAEHLKKHPKP